MIGFREAYRPVYILLAVAVIFAGALLERDITEQVHSGPSGFPMPQADATTLHTVLVMECSIPMTPLWTFERLQIPPSQSSNGPSPRPISHVPIA